MNREQYLLHCPSMPRKKTKLSPIHTYHITARCINKEWFGQSLDDVWTIMENFLHFLHHAYAVEIEAFVLMINHFHLLAKFPHLNMSEALQYFMKETSKSIAKSSHRINQTYGNRFYRCFIDSDHYFSHAYKYVYRNPVEAGVVKNVEDYKYSTLRGLLGFQPLYIPISQDNFLMEEPEQTLNWLNQPTEKENRNAIKIALSRHEFIIPKNRKTRKPHELEFNLY